ncbi:RICIN domain-containing protein [Hymenobacter puniceus]|uniref:RICIN domain-containing protein n=1 Tax=Hymenobacter sp. BT190 TaxID=2763505 RepID=UPI0016515906|nr:RICIN domain-containing protein [Hymenobacter sp. BT190]MBC6700198.1 RICIN domain-containing protein [Hymenobacter sp. BT190]
MRATITVPRVPAADVVPAGHRPATYRRILLMLLPFLLLHFGAEAQAISPQFFGINYWLANPSSGLTNDLAKADLKFMRIGGNAFNTEPYYKNASSYVAAINYARGLGAEPIVQIPIKLSKDQLSAFVADLRAYNIVYWSIGNEPDPADDKPANGTPDPINEPASWSSGGYIEPQFDYNYDIWVTQYKALAIRLKNDLPNSKLVGPDFRLFYDVVNPGNAAGIPSYYYKFLEDVGVDYHTNAAGQKRPLLDHFALHFYADRPESTMAARFQTLRGLLDRVNATRRAAGAAADITVAVTEVNAFNQMSDPTGMKAWQFKAGQFIALMAKQVMQQGGLCFTPWSIYESNADETKFDYSLYNTNTTSPSRRSTMWHLAMLSNNRQANLMNGAQNAQADNVVFVGMRGPGGYTVMLMNTTAGSTYSYRTSLNDTYAAGPEAVKIRLQGYTPLTRQLIGSLGPRTTHLYKLDPDGNVLSVLHYAVGDAAPRQQQAFNFVNVNSLAYARPLDGSATADVVQYAGDVSALSSARWLFKPAAPGYYFIVNQSTNKALRPKGATDSERVQENQLISQELLNENNIQYDYLMWEVQYTGSGGIYRLQNRRSQKYLRTQNGSTLNNAPLVQSMHNTTLTSQQWRFDAADAANEALQARGSSPALATTAGQATELRAYPNPTASRLTITGATVGSHATLRDATGRLCLTQPLDGTGELNLQALPSGLYFLTLTTPGGTFRQKVVRE